MMLPSKTNTACPGCPSGSQNPFAGQWDPVLAAKRLPLEGTRCALLIFFTMCSQSTNFIEEMIAGSSGFHISRLVSLKRVY
jgi:hypothetical protein